MLCHLKARYSVILISRDTAIIHAVDSRAVFYTPTLDLCIRIISSCLRNGDACGVSTIILCRVRNECSPSASDIKQAMTFFQLHLLADEVELLVLCLLE